MTAEEAAEAARGLTFEKVWAALMESRQRMEETRQEMKESHQETKRWLKEIQQESSRQMKESQLEAQRRLDETHRKNEKTIADLKQEFSKNVGGISNTLGLLTEAMFSPELDKKFSEYGYRFETQANNKTFKKDQQLVAEVDSVLENNEYVMLVEIKTKLAVEYVNQHLERIVTMRHYMDARGDYRKIIGTVAGGIVSESVQVYAQNKGLFVVVQSGNAATIADTPQGFKVREW